MFIKLQDLRYIRRTPGEVAVLRELVSFQRCRVICPSEFWLAQMTRLSERSVRRALVKLAKSGFISYDRHAQDFRGPCRPTNSYTLHPERIQEAIGAGKGVVAKALGAYYKKCGTPHHSRRLPAKLAGGTTGQIGPQDVSLSKEQRQDERLAEEFNMKCNEYYEDLTSSYDYKLEDINYIEEVAFNPCQQDFQTYSENVELSTQIVPILTPSPISAPPPSPPLPAECDVGSDANVGRDEPRSVDPQPATTASDVQTVEPTPDPEPESLDDSEHRWMTWDDYCRIYGTARVEAALAEFLEYHPELAEHRIQAIHHFVSIDTEDWILSIPADKCSRSAEAA